MNFLLTIALAAVVPLRILEYQGKGGPGTEDCERARRFARTLGEKGDRILYRSKVPGETADLFNALADAIAVLSFCPGGVTVFGQTYVGGCQPGTRRNPDDAAASAYINDYLRVISARRGRMQ